MPTWQANQENWSSWLSHVSIRAATLWRGVEAQHRVATLKVVDTPAEQELLETLLEESKPAVPRGAEQMHYLLVTPFRYASPWPSRFRAPHEPGVWYGAHEFATACAEVAWWRWRFATDSDAFLHDTIASELTFFAARVRGRAVDLMVAPWDAFESAWMAPHDYVACQALARAARDAHVDWIRYSSVRDPKHRPCGAVLRPEVLRMGDLTRQRSWICLVRAESVVMKTTSLDNDEPALEFRFER